ncbi:MAG: hypothetical protein HXX20_02505 [Chloroflexi bacterium]|nr:hypothetical protein [Chloroflexota bacterium]
MHLYRKIMNNRALVGILLLVLVAFMYFFGGILTKGVVEILRTKQSLDSNGGYLVVLQARDKNVSKDQMQAALDVINKRIEELSVKDSIITLQGEGSRQINVVLPGITNEKQVSALISTGRLEFIDAGSDTTLKDGDIVKTSYCVTGSLYQPRPNLCGNIPTPTDGTSSTTINSEANVATTPATNNKVYQTIITGAELDSSKVDIGFDYNTGAAKVLFGTKAAAASIFQNFTSSHLGQSMAIVLDGKIISSATIQGAIGTQGEITNPSAWSTAAGKAEVARIVAQLKYGALPVELDVLSSRKVDAPVR